MKDLRDKLGPDGDSDLQGAKLWDDLATLQCVTNLAMCLQDLEDHEEAEIYYRRALEGYEEQLGEHSTTTLSAVYNLAFLLEKSGKYEEALTLFERELAGMEHLYGPDDFETTTSRTNVMRFKKELPDIVEFRNRKLGIQPESEAALAVEFQELMERRIAEGEARRNQRLSDGPVTDWVLYKSKEG